MPSAAESKLGLFFLKSTNTIQIRYALIVLGHRQPPTPIKTDNTTELRVITNTININT